MAERKYGVLLDVESFNNVPVQRTDEPSAHVVNVCATALVLLMNAVVCGVTHATSMLQVPEVPISLTVFMSGDLSAAPVIK